jgi:zinc transporter ZupT
MTASFMFYLLILFAAAFITGLIAWIKQWSDERLHLFISFGAGIFLGAVFFELMPEAMSFDNRNSVGVAILLGYLLIFFSEKFIFSRGESTYERNHKIISIAAFFGLSVHSLVDGLGLAVANVEPDLGRTVFLSILSHHVPAAFSVTSLLILARFSRKVTVLVLALFSAMPSIGALIFSPLMSSASDQFFSLVLGTMTGTFLYVATGDLLPEVFHTPKNRWKNLLLLIVGIGVMAAISYGFKHVHER